ncbi:MAG: hypothetical protein Q7K43_02995, partial [Candidatus Woesearchaeota archaeon]|nr:hypothetical protein [Candidatus Woesearchaeota archaeon]
MGLFTAVPASLRKYESILQKLRKEEQGLAKSINEKERVLQGVTNDIKVQIAQFHSNDKHAQERIPELAQIEQSLAEKERILAAKELSLK